MGHMVPGVVARSPVLHHATLRAHLLTAALCQMSRSCGLATWGRCDGRGSGGQVIVWSRGQGWCRAELMSSSSCGLATPC